MSRREDTGVGKRSDEDSCCLVIIA
jgi:hypothetical protein